MNTATALKIVSALADGSDPFSGQRIPDSCVLHNAEVVRALFFAIAQLKALKLEEATLCELQSSISTKLQWSWEEYCAFQHSEPWASRTPDECRWADAEWEVSEFQSRSVDPGTSDELVESESDIDECDEEETEYFEEEGCDAQEEDDSAGWWIFAFSDYDAYVDWQNSCD